MKVRITNTLGDDYEIEVDNVPPGTSCCPSVFDVTPLTPHRCPVCEGRCVMPFNFYNRQTMAANMTADTVCKSCAGKGVIYL